MLLNKRQLAAKLGVDRHFVTSMCAAGFEFRLGRRTTLDDALAWLREKGPAFQGHQRRAKKTAKKSRRAKPPSATP
jgi:hypothetical protein